MASLILFNLYQNMFLRGEQGRITHAVIFDEAHRASKLKLIPTMAKECRKYGIALVIASQEAKDFDDSVFAATAHYLALRVADADAVALAKKLSSTNEVSKVAERLKRLEQYTALFFSEGKAPYHVRLADAGEQVVAAKL